jgi:FeS assembly SUF system protein
MEQSPPDISTPDRQPLPVLPHSGKVDQLKESIASTKELPPSVSVPASTAMHESSPNLTPSQAAIEGNVIEVLRSIYDPEIPLNIYDLGLIYKIAVDAENHVTVTMTLTSPGCPVAGSLPGEVERRIEGIAEVKSADVVLVWEPAWDKSRLSEAALLDLGLI